MVLLFLACASADSAKPTDSDPSSTEPTDSGTSFTLVCADGINGAVTGGFSGDGQFLVLREDYGGWSDGCYGGRIDPPHDAEEGVFDWPASFHEGAGAPEPRPIRAVGCAATDQLVLSIVEEDGTPFWGPWTLLPDPQVEDIEVCD